MKCIKLPTNWRYLERVLFLFARIVILISLWLWYFVSEYWFILTLLVWVNLIIFALSGFCLVYLILNKVFNFKSRLK